MLAHVGVIGMSVPYLVSLTQSGKESVATIPIEFVVADTADETGTLEGSVQSEQKATDVEPVLASPNTVAMAKISKQPQVNDLAEATSQTATDIDTGIQNSSVAQPAEPAAEEKVEATPEPVTPNPVSSSSGDQPQDNNPSSPETEIAPENAEPEVEDAEPEVEDSGPEIIEGESLEPPAPTDSELGQSVSIRIGGVQEDVVQDAPDVLPVLKSDRELGTRRSEAEGCGPVELPAPTVSLVYRLRIGVEGAVELATLQPTGDGALVSDVGKEAIACLIETSGMTFSPAMLNGEAKLDDSLLVTFELVDVS